MFNSQMQALHDAVQAGGYVRYIGMSSLGVAMYVFLCVEIAVLKFIECAIVILHSPCNGK